MTGTVTWMSSPDAREELVRADLDDEVEIARRRAFGAGVALAGQADALAVARAGLDAELQRLAARDHAGAVAGGAGVLHLAAAAAARALDVELHAAAHLRHLAGAVALGALHAAAGDGACPCRWGTAPGAGSPAA